ncbi:hypothetical protein CYMTET_32598 [Cymbomonas tetramitiformis]|uniref:Uncharacterized protein n=1 Tax=Cymbomonas tetramitiformis TaxID=36881 RepID=A0AAE0FEQ1_9CHLO|nr:hypothetical protein CYMTET_32598 [Cymbomonas tetramitiformis]
MNLKDAVTWYPRAYMRANTSGVPVMAQSDFYTENGKVRLCNSSKELHAYYYNQIHFTGSATPNYCDATLCMYPDYDAQNCDCNDLKNTVEESCPEDTSYVCCTLMNQNGKTCYCLGHTDYATNNGAAIRDAGVNVTNGLPVKHNRSVLVVEAPDTIQTVPVYLSNTVTRLLGVVVRRGGVLFMDDVDSELDLHFMIVESGGLFQAGSRHSAAHRFQSHLVIQYEHEYWVDAGNAPLTASQYSVEVLHPGVKLEPTNVVYNVKINQTMTTYNVSKQVRDFTGSLGNNYGVAKGLAVFFNGNYQLNSVVPGRVPYAGTWNVDRTCPSDQNCHMDVRETVREAEAPLTEDEDAYHVAFEYPMTWARLGRPHHTGDRYLVLNVKDCSNDGWQAAGSAGAAVDATTWPPRQQTRATAGRDL